jgi:nonsense-mediated mRNA decay protein 3
LHHHTTVKFDSLRVRANIPSWVSSFAWGAQVLFIKLFVCLTPRDSPCDSCDHRQNRYQVNLWLWHRSRGILNLSHCLRVFRCIAGTMKSPTGYHLRGLPLTYPRAVGNCQRSCKINASLTPYAATFGTRQKSIRKLTICHPSASPENDPLAKISSPPGLIFGHYSSSDQYNSSYTMVTMNYEPSAAAQESYILCADCGTVINSSNGANLCE